MTHYVELNFPGAKDARKPGFFALPIWACGFRPFFLGGALVAAALILSWLHLFFSGTPVGGAAGPIGWHAHEMLFGFTTAIIAGFLLTAVPKWTRTRAHEGKTLFALFVLWAAGRVALAAAGVLPYALVAVVDFLFLPALAVAISIPIIGSRTPRNFGFVPLLFGLAAANGLFHLAHLGVLSTSYSAFGLDAALGIIMVIIAIIGGRVIPFFTLNRIGYGTTERGRLIDRAAIALTVTWLVLMLIWPVALWTGVIALLAGAANLYRMRGWASFKTLKVPLLWILHAGYAFVGLGLILYGLSALQLFGTRSLAIHALSAGAMGVLCLGMMARVALGHTGRELKAHKVTAIAFALICAAALLRLLGAALPAVYTISVMGSGLLWTAAWVLFLVIYTPVLFRPRADGRPG